MINEHHVSVGNISDVVWHSDSTIDDVGLLVNP